MKIERAHRTDAKKLTELTIRSKDYWNYGTKQIEEWRDDLTINQKYIDENQVYKLTVADKLTGFYAFQPENTKTIKLSFLFIEPEAIGKGYGKVLVSDFLQRIEESEFESVVLDADPNAEKFYERFGFKTIGKLKSSIADRYLPVMEMKITQAYNVEDP